MVSALIIGLIVFAFLVFIGVIIFVVILMRRRNNQFENEEAEVEWNKITEDSMEIINLIPHESGHYRGIISSVKPIKDNYLIRFFPKDVILVNGTFGMKSGDEELYKLIDIVVSSNHMIVIPKEQLSSFKSVMVTYPDRKEDIRSPILRALFANLIDFKNLANSLTESSYAGLTEREKIMKMLVTGETGESLVNQILVFKEIGNQVSQQSIIKTETKEKEKPNMNLI